jgi:hypothetical protein
MPSKTKAQALVMMREFRILRRSQLDLDFFKFVAESPSTCLRVKLRESLHLKSVLGWESVTVLDVFGL